MNTFHRVVLALTPFLFCGMAAVGQTVSEMAVQSNSFDPEAMIPVKFTCDGINVSPDLFWSGSPAGTVSFAIVCSDPDAPSGNWIHWVLYNIPTPVKRLPENFTASGGNFGEIRSGKNDAGMTGYFGPCPPSGIHRYFFRIYALDRWMEPKDGITANELNRLMTGHILASGTLMGKYQRK